MRATPDPATSGVDLTATDVGSVFVSNYPPYSFWSNAVIPRVQSLLDCSPNWNTKIGLYLHIPFCRKRCKFCYFRVYTDRNSDQIQTYLDGLAHEVELYSRKPAIANRTLQFVYFGGGTPSYISARHLRKLVERLQKAMPWTGVEEITFECEPGTLTQSKLETIRDLGITRLSLGLENLDDEILRRNGRAHVSREIFEIMPWIDGLGFEQVNVDLISGMAGETWESWRATVKKTLEFNPDSVTIYQMELPHNTVFSKDVADGDGPKLANWETKRAWHEYAFTKMEAAGYDITSAYTATKSDRPTRFVYRDAVWSGQDLIGAGVASFSHIGGVHYQNSTQWESYLHPLTTDTLPVCRGFIPTLQERLTREVILQLKLGHLSAAYFQNKYDVDIIQAYGPIWDRLEKESWATTGPSYVELTRSGLLRVDQLLPQFYASPYRESRYT